MLKRSKLFVFHFKPWLHNAKAIFNRSKTNKFRTVKVVIII